jgi:DNA-binding MarR family transcriptional regulator
MKSKEILVALRRIMRAVDLHSKELERKAGLTVPQILIMQAVQEAGGLQVSEIARRVSLSHSTVTSVLDRLEKKEVVQRNKIETDHRVVRVTLTIKGMEQIINAPELLQKDFVDRFQHLEPWEQTMLTSAVQRIASLMDAQTVDASPILQAGEILPNNSPGKAHK